MTYKLINATAAKSGTAILIDGTPCIVRSNDISKSGKHGASKCRIEVIGVIDGKKKVIAIPGSERFEVPLIQKKKGQILSISGEKANMMDLDTFETTEIEMNEEVEEVKEGDRVEYWEVEGARMIKRKI